MGGNEILNVVVQNLGTLPSSGTAGQIIYYTADQSFRVWTGSEWVALLKSGTVPSASTTSPLMDGTASAGTTTTYARGDHRHPTDTTRAAASDLTAHTGDGDIHVTADQKTAWDGMQPMSERDQASGYAGLTADGKVLIGVIPTGNVAQTIPLLMGTISDGMILQYSSSAGGFVAWAPDTVYKPKGSVATYADLPSDASAGDVYNVIAAYGNVPAGTNWVWTGEEWDALGGTVDLSAYATIVALNSGLAGKQDVITGGASTITSSDLAASRALVSDASGKVAVSAITSTELGYLDGVTSSVQTQLNGKATRYAGTISGDGTTTSWTLTHGLGNRPTVTVYDASDNEVITQLTVTTTQITVSVNTALASGEQFYIVAVA